MPDHPDYRIDIAACPHVGRVWVGDTLLAESAACLLVTETDHVDRLYFPARDVRWDLFTPSELSTVCPFKGRARYWNGPGALTDVVWSYPEPLPHVAAIADHVSFYDDRVRVELVENWPAADTQVPASFPLWGDARELLRLIDVEQTGDGEFRGPAHGPTRRNVVEGGQLLAQAVVAGSKILTGQRVTSASMIFTKSASFDEPVDVSVEVLRRGRSFSTAEVSIRQHDSLRGVGLLLADSGAPDVLRSTSVMPDIPGPQDATAFPGFGTTGREIRVVDAAYDPDPDRIGPPEINVWVRFRDAPGQPYLHAALLAQSTTHWTIAAAMRPHPGFGEALAHRTLSTGIMKATIAFHDDADVTDWLLYTNRVLWSGRGLVQGDGLVFTRDGRLVASYTTQAMVRAFAQHPATMGHDSRTAM